MLNHLTVELLPNGFYRVFDYRCKWASIYNADGTYRHGATDNADYRKAVQQFKQQEATR